jgi:CheY-like chemotaxis protein
MTAALLNIFSNAVDAMPEGGPIELTARRCAVDQDRCDWTDLNFGEYLSLNIRDYGCGMSTEQVAHAFEPFYSTKNSESGTGLGLSSVHGFVRQSGGDIRILSTLNEGTEIQVLLPLTTSEASSPPPAPSGHVAARDRKRMLLVEDNGAVAKSLLKLLEHLGFRAEWAACGKDAISVLQKDQDFDFVLSDVNMPRETDGLALARWIESEKSKLPVFLMSGYNELPSGNLNIPLIPKPFSVKQLKEFLQQSFATKSKQ